MAKPLSPSVVRCAVYTRKSSEDGLDQSFNSLHAQREACEAYVTSQKHEGWRLISTLYDDGGWSGGTMERPALKRLLADVQAGLVDTIVVYKVDRLSRALTDFARMVDLFDTHGCSFVSVTQAFNTTTSMGRLTLNMLLSFAQFEREVTGERIRDKIAASKAKGMWMGGIVPLGYDPDGRTLAINEPEAEQVRTLFDLYLAHRSADAVVAHAHRLGITSKRRVGADGSTSGGRPLTRGALYRILANHLYVGEIAHKGQVHPGLHQPIMPRATFDAAQALLAQQRRRRHGNPGSTTASPLAGLLFDDQGNRLSPTHTVKGRKRYRYYAGSTTGLVLPATIGRERARLTLVVPGMTPATPDPALIGLVAQARIWFEQLTSGERTSLAHIARTDRVTPAYVRQILPAAFLAPDLVTAIVEGRQPPALTATRLRSILPLPRDWQTQRNMFAALENARRNRPSSHGLTPMSARRRDRSKL